MGKKLTIFMLDGSGPGPKTFEIGNWSGKGIYSPRSGLRQLLDRVEFERTGVYLLKRASPTSEFAESVYIGEADELRSRLKRHLAAKRDFDSVMVFVSKDDTLTKAHGRYLEARLIHEAKEANTSRVENINTPKVPPLSEADISDMEYFLAQIVLVLPAAGVQALVPSVKHVPTPEPAASPLQPEYYLKSRNLMACMRETNEGIVVLKGSQTSKDNVKSIGEGWVNLKRKLISENALVDRGSFFEFTQNTVFSSPSAAASVLLGRQAAGPIHWITKEGKTYKAVQSEELRSPASRGKQRHVGPIRVLT